MRPCSSWGTIPQILNFPCHTCHNSKLIARTCGAYVAPSNHCAASSSVRTHQGRAPRRHAASASSSRRLVTRRHQAAPSARRRFRCAPRSHPRPWAAWLRASHHTSCAYHLLARAPAHPPPATLRKLRNSFIRSRGRINLFCERQTGEPPARVIALHWLARTHTQHTHTHTHTHHQQLHQRGHLCGVAHFPTEKSREGLWHT